MGKETIEIQVEPEAAQAYAAASPEDRRKLDLLLSIRIRELAGRGSDLERVMAEISERAKERGLTEEKLAGLLEDE